MHLAPQGAPKLTAKQERFAQLVALVGLNQSDAYREAYNVGVDTSGPTVNQNAYRLMQHAEIALRIAALKEASQAQSIASRERILQELSQVAYAPIKGEVRAADKTPERPIQITKVTVNLDHGDGNITEEVSQLGGKVVEGEATLMEPEDAGA